MMCSFRQAVEEKLQQLYVLVETHYGVRIRCQLEYDLRGTTAGHATVHARWGRKVLHASNNIIRLNGGMVEDPLLHQAMVEEVVAHELAHIVCGHCFPQERGHGRHWKQVARTLGCSGNRTHSFDVSRHQVRKLRRFNYRCSPSCGQPHQLTTIRHNRVQQGTRYHCTRCHTSLQWVDEP